MRLATHQLLLSKHADFEPGLFLPPKPDPRDRVFVRFADELDLLRVIVWRLREFSRKYRRRIRPGIARLSPVYSKVIRLGDGGIRKEASRFTALLSAVIASI